MKTQSDFLNAARTWIRMWYPGRMTEPLLRMSNVLMELPMPRRNVVSGKPATSQAKKCLSIKISSFFCQTWQVQAPGLVPGVEVEVESEVSAAAHSLPHGGLLSQDFVEYEVHLAGVGRVRPECCHGGRRVEGVADAHVCENGVEQVAALVLQKVLSRSVCFLR